MTSHTGSTEMTKETKGPPFLAAIGGGCLQLGTLAYVWSQHTSAGDALRAPLATLRSPGKADPWGASLVMFVPYVLTQWLLSLRTVPSTGTSDPSIVDRLWSVMPWVYCWGWLLRSSVGKEKPSGRLLAMTLLSTVWGLRLTWNFWKKGGYSGGEDYRWAVVRKWYPGFKWEIFNFIFVCSFQQATILAFTTPAVAAMQSSKPLGALDVAAGSLYSALVLGETVADQQMWNYQTEKYRRKNAGEDLGPYSRGFIETGLWSISRHPNYFCEVSTWWAFYLFSVPATGRWLNWTIWGPLFLTGLFVPPGASLDVTEQLSKAKYPLYGEYQERVSRFIPWFPKAKTA